VSMQHALHERLVSPDMWLSPDAADSRCLTRLHDAESSATGSAAYTTKK